MLPRVPLLALVVLALAAPTCPESNVRAGALAERGRVWERFETLGWIRGDFANPFDPDEIRVDGEFVAPDGSSITMPGFYTREYRRALVGGYEHLTPYGDDHWAVRMTPTMPGTWSWRWVVTTQNGVETTDWRAFDVDPPAPDRHGFLHRSPLDARYLRFDDGSPWIGVGENLCWYDGRGTFAYDDWIAKLAAQGVTFIRLWMPSWAFGLEWTVRAPDGSVASSSLGDYRDRLDRAWQLDYVMDLAARNGIAVMLSIQNHGAFSLTNNSEWADNPYNAANGGPLATPAEFLTNAEARALFQRRLRYLVARWGAATNLQAWELWNEADLVASGAAMTAWHAEMADALRGLDPYQHPISTSRASANASAAYWSLPEIDFTQVHFYSFPLPLDMPSVVAPLLGQHLAAQVKPTLLGEYGVDYRGPAETLENDPDGIGFHQGLWIGLLAGGFGTGLSWWWDNVVDPEDYYFHFGAIARFAAGVAFDAQGFEPIRPAVAADGRNLAAYALRGRAAVLAWVQNVDHQWLLPPLPGPDPTPVEGATLALTGVTDGAWTARWIDAYTGMDIATEPVTVAGGAATLAVPTFAKDVALRMER